MYVCEAATLTLVSVWKLNTDKWTEFGLERIEMDFVLNDGKIEDIFAIVIE